MPDVRGLAIWSALAAGVLPVLFFVVLPNADAVRGAASAREDAERPAAIATVLTVCSPLFWFTAARPLSDVAGLAAAWAALAALALGSDLVFHHFRRAGADNDERQNLTPNWIAAGAFMAGLSIGFRSQMAILTMPLLLWVFVAVARMRVAAIAAAAAGVAVWALPLVWFSGGPRRYLQALGSQAGEDFSGVVMLWTHPTPRAAVAAILQTFVRPWDSPILAGVMLVLAAAGAFVLLTRSPRVLAIVAVVFGPYAVFHLLFQETYTSRYALPLVPLIGYLAAVVLAEAGPPASPDHGRRAGWCQPGLRHAGGRGVRQYAESDLRAALRDAHAAGAGRAAHRRHAPAGVHRVEARAPLCGRRAGHGAPDSARLRVARADAGLARRPRRGNVVRRRSAPHRSRARSIASTRARARIGGRSRAPSTSAAPDPTNWTGTSSASRGGFWSKAGR